MFDTSKLGAVDIIRGNESLNLEQIEAVSELLMTCEESGQPRIVLDLANVPLIDSAGLEMLLDARDRCLRKGGSLKLASPNPLCRDILRITDLVSKFEIFDEAVIAAGSFAQ